MHSSESLELSFRISSEGMTNLAWIFVVQVSRATLSLEGVALSQDGIPINFADGSYIIGVLEPQVSNLVEIYRGANALEYGGATLGGAMNFVTKNGYNASPLSVKMEAGSFNYFNSTISSGFSSGKSDLFVASSYNH